MQEGNLMIRDYEVSDYEACKTLVNEAWEFDKHFAPRELSELCLYIYTFGSLAQSNFSRVVVQNSKVVGFLFGVNFKATVPEPELHSFYAQLKLLKRLFFIKGMTLKEKFSFLKATQTHQMNRAELIEGKRSEICLFIVRSGEQGKGYGKKLLAEFMQFCKQHQVDSIIVETNRVEASSFYEHVGFTLIGDFHSPLHDFQTGPDGQACMYECILQS